MDQGHPATRLDHPDGSVVVEEIMPGRRRVTVETVADSLFVPFRECETSYPLPLLQKILAVKGPAYLCDEILRDESADYVQKHLRYDVSGYLDDEFFADKRLLDFGSGAGGSTMVLCRMFPRTSIVGVELEERLVGIARARAAYYGFGNIEFHVSPTGA